MKIVVLDGAALNPGDLSWDGIAQHGALDVFDATAPEATLERMAGAEVVFTNKVPITQAVLEASPDLRLVSVLATGYNVVDTAAAKQCGVLVCNVPAYGTDAVAQFAFALLLEICHHVGHHAQAVQAGRWSSSRVMCFWDYPLIELAGKTLGIIGYGRIGQAVGKIARAFGMRVLSHDAAVQAQESVDLDTLLSQSDVISLHCPLTPQTQGLIHRGSIAKMKDGVILLNTARGPLVVEQDLREAIESGKVYAAAVDVVSAEPIREDNPLLGLDRVLITPHIAWAPKESRQRLMDVSAENLRAYLRGTPQNVVNG